MAMKYSQRGKGGLRTPRIPWIPMVFLKFSNKSEKGGFLGFRIH